MTQTQTPVPGENKNWHDTKIQSMVQSKADMKQTPTLARDANRNLHDVMAQPARVCHKQTNYDSTNARQNCN